ncbi:MAG: hypothetical protein KJ044_01535 [Planctomycetes bacterium]|nr:hypothetical protein [Planctomycetota bacterium]
MTRTMPRNTASQPAMDAYQQTVLPGDFAVDLTSGVECVGRDHIPARGPQSLYVQMTGHGGPEMTYWVEPGQLMKLPRAA